MVTRKKPQEPISADCMPKCSACDHFLIDPKDDAGICRRYPPDVIVINDELTMAVRTVDPEYRCGEFKRRTN